MRNNQIKIIMKNFINTFKYISVIIVAIFLFVGVPKTHAMGCWLDHGPAWMNCDLEDNSDDDDSDDDDDDDDSDNLSVSTLSASSVDEDSATLRGEITDLDESEDYDRWFEWGTDSDDLDHTTNVSGTTDNEGSFSRSISNLSDDREYFFRACAESNDSNDEDCGSVRSFTTDEENDNDDDDSDNDNDNNNSDAIITTDATGVTTNSATLNGVVINDSGSQRVWFEYGTTTYLGSSTSSKLVSGDESLVSIQLGGLSSSTAYFFRIVNDDGERGEIRSLVTKSWTGITTTPPPPTTPKPTTTTVVVKSDQYLNVDLVSSVKEANAGDALVYEVVYENLTSVGLKSIKIVVDFPEGITPEKTDAGSFISKQNIEVAIPSLGAKEKGSFTIVASVNRDVSADEFLVSIIEATYPHPTTENTSISTVDYSILKIIKGGRDNDQSANALFALGVFPMNFWGWLLIVGLIILIIVFASKAYKKDNKDKNGHDHNDHDNHSDHSHAGLKIVKS